MPRDSKLMRCLRQCASYLIVCLLMTGCGASGGTVAAASDTAPSAAAAAEAAGTRSANRASAVLPSAAKSAASVTLRTTADWGSGFTAVMTITNAQSTAIGAWRLELDFAADITAIWDARIISRSGTRYVIAGSAWNADIPAGSTVSFGFNGAPGGAVPQPTNIVLNGVPLGTSPSPTPTPAPSPTPAPTPAPSPPLPSGVDITYTTTSDWGSGFGGSVTITNRGTTTLRDWSLAFDFDRSLDTVWSAQVASRTGTRYTVRPESWNRDIAPGGKVSFGFNGSPGNVRQGPTGWAFTSATTTPPPPLPSPTPAPSPTPSPSPSPSPAPGPTPAPSPSPAPPSGGTGLPARKRIAYFVEWGIYQRAFFPSDIPAASLDVVNYAFANISERGEVIVYDSWAATDKAFPGDTWDQPLRGCFNQLIKLKQQHPHLRTMISIGGWTLSGRFSDVALTDASRRAFAASAVAFMTRYGFDGVDIDWEYPVGGGLSTNVTRPQDKQNYTLLLRALRDALDAQGVRDGKRYLLTIAAPAGASTYAHIELAAVAGIIDWFNLMTYDYHGGWESTTNHHCALYANPADRGDATMNVAATVQGYRAAGVPAHQLVVGVGAYGRSWKGVPTRDNGLFQTSAGVPFGTWDDTGVFDYSDLVNRLAAGTTFVRSWDSAAKVPWLYAAGRDGGTFVTYEDAESAALKVDFVKTQGLGGLMMWELSSDIRDVTSPLSLLGVINRRLAP